MNNNLNLLVKSQQLQAIFDTAVDCIIMIDSQGIINKINPSGERLFGYQPNELIGQKINILMPPPDRTHHDKYIQNYEATRQPKVIGKGRDVTGLKKNGTRFPCHLSVNQFMMHDKKCYAGIIHDLTDRKKAEQEIISLNKILKEKIEIKSADLSSVVKQLLQANERLEKEISERKKIEQALRDNELEIKKALANEKELSDLKSRFITMASHEFRTPLSTILSSTNLLQSYWKKGQIDRSEKHFTRIQSSVHHLNQTLDDFLSLSKLDEGKILLNPTSFNLKIFCNDFIEQHESLLKEGQQLIKEIPNDEVEIFLDQKLLEHILLNLFSNAIKYTPEGKVICCKVQLIDNQLIIAVKDEGMGIPESEQKHLFSRFYRGSNVVNIKGTGLGLNIVKEYLELLNGNISFESKEGEGSTFTISIPIN